MQLESMLKRLKTASRNIFLSMNNSAIVKKKYVEPHVFVKIDGKQIKIKDITVSECNIYLETEDNK